MIWQKLMMAAGQLSGGGVDIADVFSVDLYTGNGLSGRNIVTGLDMSGDGGLVWLKRRNSTSDHLLHDTARTATAALRSNSTGAEFTPFQGLSGFTSDGFSVGPGAANGNGDPFVAWSFKKAPGFFDIVTYTGDGVAGRTVPHSLGEAPGMMIIKRTDGSADWNVYHRAVGAAPAQAYLDLNQSQAVINSGSRWNDTSPSSAQITLGNSSDVNRNGSAFVAYLFAHNPDNGILCGSYTGNGSSSGPSVNLGWEPQFVMIKRADGGGNNWLIFDNVRGLGVGNDAILYPNKSFAEDSADFLEVSSSGFQVATGSSSEVNASGGNYIFMAIKAP